MYRCPLQGAPARWRDFHSATIIGTKMFVFGGRADRFGPFHSNNEIYCNKIKVFDTETNCWLSSPSAQPLPEGRRSHSACKWERHAYKDTRTHGHTDRDTHRHSHTEGHAHARTRAHTDTHRQGHAQTLTHRRTIARTDTRTLTPTHIQTHTHTH